MSTMAGAADSTQKKYPSHCYGRKNNSDELDVFEAAGYYSGQNDGPLHPWWTWRMSLDEHVKRPSMFLPQRLGKQASSSSSSRHRFEQRQPRSPGGRLASFLNSLFSQSNSKKKMSNKSSSGGSSSMLQSSGKDYEDPDQRRRRRSSISHFRSSSSTKEFYSKSSTNGVSNFYHSNYNNKNSKVTTPTKSHKDFRSSSAHREADASSKPMASTGNKKKSLGSVGGKSSLLQSKSLDEEEIRGSSSKFHGKFNNDDNNNDKDGCSKESTLVDQEGEESDSSSDLFELQIGAGGYYSSDLPVYETTHMERIRSENPPISLNVIS